ncbi:hypothetical protein PIB30_027167 [Stylosanthes scabra]|uniref:RRM domain-containing protein n=1 Tax=Stylosanthes scabra TaxID=79078 RepID=A0ABU6QAR7_9FABA|nr:hypothetical protein [Stylosanthes scabra]
MKEGWERENQRASEGNTNGVWRVIARRRQSNHWRQGQKPIQQQAWIQRTSTRPRDLQKGSKWNEEETFNIFADNLPEDATLEWLWKVFGKTGKVVDIYLSRKIRRANTLKFAFIRYRSREEVETTIDHLDGWLVWGCDAPARGGDFRVAWSLCLSSRLPRVTRCHRYNPAVTRTSCALAKYGASDLCPEMTNSIGSPLSPGQTCCHQIPKHLYHAVVANLVRSWNCHYASKGVGRITLRV